MQNSEPLTSSNTEALASQLSKNLLLHTILEQEAIKMGYGQIMVNVEIKDGVADIKTLNIVINQRIRY